MIDFCNESKNAKVDGDCFFTVEYLTMQFHIGKNNIPKVQNGLDTTTPDNTKLIKAVSRSVQ